MNKKILKLNLILILCIAAGFLLRITDLNIRSLEYDEIWTLKNYIKCSFFEIFTNLETPNNHPLPTWLTKTLCSFAGYENWALRLSAFLSGVGLMLLIWWYGCRNLYSKYAKIVLIALTAFSPYLIHYSNTARGYSMQALFVFVMVILLFSYAQKPSICKALGVFISAAAVLFTVYSGLIFVCAASGAYMLTFFDWQNWRKEFKKNLFLFAAAADFSIIAALWLGLNWEKIAKAQQFGTEINSFVQFFQSAGHLIYDLGLLLPAAIIVIALILHPKDKIVRFGMLFAVFTFLSILVTRCGPERVYMPMIAVVILCAARGFEIVAARFYKIKYFELALAVLACLPLAFVSTEIARISPPDWYYFVSQIEKNTPEECYVVYPAGDTYPILFNYTESAVNLAKRSGCDLHSVIFISPKAQKISCLAEDISEKTVELGKTTAVYPLSNNYKMSYYALELLNEESFRPGAPLVAFFVFMPKNQYFAIRKQLYLHDDCYLLNAFFNRDYETDNAVQKFKAIPYLIPSASQNYRFYAELEKNGGGKLKFYLLKP